MADNEYFQRTAVTRLAVDATERERLEEIVHEWRRGCQIAVDSAWGVCHTRNEVQQLAYDELRERTQLGSQHAILATHRAAEAIKDSLEGAASDESATKPEFTSPSVVYDARTMTVFEDDSVSLTTTDERVRCDLALPSGDGYQLQYLDDDRWEPCKSTLHYRDGEFHLHLRFRTPRPDVEPPGEDATVLGVDLGVENVAVTSTARFFPGGELRDRRRRFRRLRDGLDEADTRNASRTLKRAGYRADQYANNRLHEIANGIVAEAETHSCDIVAFGELDDVRDLLPDAEPFHEWAFERLVELVRYRAAERGITVVQVNPEYTSQRCAECGFTHPQNRDLDANHFECLKCESEANDDYNAAKNVAFRCIRRGPLSSRGVGASYCALQSGRVTPDGEFTSHAEARETSASE